MCFPSPPLVLKVDWYPWGDEAFEQARKRDVPIFLSSASALQFFGFMNFNGYFIACYGCCANWKHSFTHFDLAVKFLFVLDAC